MSQRYKLTFKFVDTEEHAKRFCDNENKNRYIRRYHKACYTPWVSRDGSEHKFIVWYVTK